MKNQYTTGMNSQKIFSIIAAERSVLTEQYHVKRIGVFGSFVSGNANEDSDVDMLVEFSQPVGLEFVELKHYLENKFQRKVDLVTPNALKPQLRDKILDSIQYS